MLKNSPTMLIQNNYIKIPCSRTQGFLQNSRNAYSKCDDTSMVKEEICGEVKVFIRKNVRERIRQNGIQYIKGTNTYFSIIFQKSKENMNRIRYQDIGQARTECDSSSEKDYESYYGKTNPLKHKTELCKTFSELGFCNYGQKCRFAHGAHELIVLPKNEHLRQRRCNGFWGKCQCNYGIRCQFGHSRQDFKEKIILHVAKACFVDGQTDSSSRLLGMLTRQ